MARLYINSLSILAPGMMGLEEALPYLTGKQEWNSVDLDKIVTDLLPANERRRTTPLIKFALRVSQDAMPGLNQDDAIASVFASSDGDMGITDKICKALSLADKPVSPIQFHNSVHNAVAGYWAIASNFQKPSISISAGDATFTAGLLEASSQVALDKAPVLYVAYDYPAPELLNNKRQFDFPFATAMLLSTEENHTSLASINIEVLADAIEPSHCISSSLETRRLKNPIAKSLPLLEAIVSNKESSVYLSYINQQTIQVTVCH